MKKELCRYPGCTNIAKDNHYCAQHQHICEQYEKEDERLERIRQERFYENEVYKYNKSLRASPAYREICNILRMTIKKCQLCGKEGDLHIHHIISPNGCERLFNDPNNLIVVCHECHRKLHNNQML